MKRSFFYILGMLSFLITFASCSDNDDAPEVEESVTSISFTLNLGQSYSSTRVGDNFETKVDENNIYVLIYDTDLKYVGSVENIQLEETIEEGRYKFSGVVKPKLAPGTYRFMVAANCTKPEANNNLEYEVSVLDDANGWIPMWGVTTYNVDNSHKQHIPGISLIRAAAKVDISLNDELINEGYTITKVSITKSSTKGFVFPKNWDTLNNSYNFPDLNSASKLLNYFKVPEDNVIAENKGFKLNSAKNYAYTYLPEYDNLSDNSKEALINVDITKDGKTKTYQVEFTSYKDGKPEVNTLWNVIRNVDYQYVINSIDAYMLKLNVSVLPWDYDEETWDYSDQISIDGDKKLKWVEGTYNSIDKTGASVVLHPGMPLVGHFTINTPVGSQWHASFVSMDGLNNAYVFKVNGAMTASGNVGEEAELIIEPINDNITENNKAILRVVVVTPDGRTLKVNELLPPGYGDNREYTIIQSK